MADSATSSDLLRNSTLYREFLAEREEIMRHKWLESEKAGSDIGFEEALENAKQPFREFMLNQTREADLVMFAELGGYGGFIDEDDIPMKVLLPSFLTSELKTAFQIGFLIFIPFLVIDLVVASVLMSLGMMMLSPMLISLPFKIMLFVLIDGWSLIVGTLAASFVT